MSKLKLDCTLLDLVAIEVDRFDDAAENLRQRLNEEPRSCGTKQSAALKRAALDLKNALTLITQSRQW